MAIFGDLSITTSDGTLLTAPNDLRLAWAWAEHEVNARPDDFPGGWATASHAEQNATVADALRELRRAYAETN